MAWTKRLLRDSLIIPIAVTNESLLGPKIGTDATLLIEKNREKKRKKKKSMVAAAYKGLNGFVVY